MDEIILWNPLQTPLSTPSFSCLAGFGAVDLRRCAIRGSGLDFVQNQASCRTSVATVEITAGATDKTVKGADV